MKPYKIVIAFILCTIIGTLSHEAGHILVAKSLGYETTLHFASMSWQGSFVLQHFSIMSGTESRLILEVVPDSGTDE